MRNRAYFFPLRMFIYRWEENDHVSSTVFFPIGCRSRKSLFICIKLKDSELCRVAEHAPSGRQRSLSPEIASSPLKWMGSCRFVASLDTPHPSPMVAVARVAGNLQLSIEMNGIVSLCRWVSLVVWTGLKSISIKKSYWFKLNLNLWFFEVIYETQCF